MVNAFVKRFNQILEAFMRTRFGKFVFIHIVLMVFLMTCKGAFTREMVYKNQIRNCEEFEKFMCQDSGINADSNQYGFSCMCTSPSFFGEHCQMPREKPVSFISRILSLFSFGISDLGRGRPAMWWSIFPFTSELQLKTIYAFHQSTVKRLQNVFEDDEYRYSARILPPARPMKCCGNDKNLPPLKNLYDGIFKRKPGQFIPDRNNRNLLYSTFYQYFILQFFDVDSNMTVTASQLYGSDPVSERSLRSFSGGKLRTLKVNNKHYAPNQAFSLRSNIYLNAWTKSISNFESWLSRMIPRKFKEAKMLSTSPMLFVLSTLWVREHNLVCDELSRKSPSWTDEELYITARKIVTGQMMTIMMSEILNVKLRPEVYHHRVENIRGSGTPIELYLTMAASSLPEKLQYNSTRLTSFSNTREVMKAGLKDALKFMMNSKTGMVTAHNDGILTEPLTKTLMTLSREQCLQGFNNYRRLLGLPAYKNFFDLTGNLETAKELKKLYRTVENVELLTGVLTERSRIGALPTAKVLSNSFIINAILTNNLTTKHSWGPDTFGGVEFFELVKSTSLKKLVRRHVEMNYYELLTVYLYAK